MNPVSGISPQSTEALFSSPNPSMESVTFRNAAQVTDAELSELLRPEPKSPFKTALPQLPAPQPTADPHDFYEVPASMGASVLTLIARIAAESRRSSADQRAAEVENLVARIRDQASDMKDKAEKQFFWSVLAGATTIATGVAVIGVSAAFTPKMLEGMSQGELSARQTKFSTMVGAFNSIGTGTSNIIQSVGTQRAGLEDAKIKLKEADQERSRALIDQLRSTEESLLDLVRKAIAAQDAIQQNTNQARTRILG